MRILSSKMLLVTPVLLFLALLLCLPFAHAQLTESTLKGVVVDATASAVRRANVLVTNEATGISRKVISGDDGSFTVTDLSPGNYSVEVKAQGYKTFEQTHLQLNVGTTTQVNAPGGRAGSGNCGGRCRFIASCRVKGRTSFRHPA